MTTTYQFRQNSVIALDDIQLQGALDQVSSSFTGRRNDAFALVPDAEQLRDHFKAMRSNTLANLAEHLERFEKKAQAAGVVVHWAKDGAAARQIVLDLALKHGVKLVAKSKSMVTEEIHLNEALEEAGIDPIETDLGEYLIQLAGQPPSHIIAPAIHMTTAQAAALLSQQVGRELSEDAKLLMKEARALLRQQFIDAGMGITGGNIMVAESGSLVLVMNEGNGRMVTTLPKIHVALVGLEKIVPTWDDAAVWLSVLARSATGQPMSIYTNIVTGPCRPEDTEGPEEVHLILLDNGRADLIGTKYEEVLQCIRCGACLNICPVYGTAGGHAYGSPYSGPIGAVITPLLQGLDEYSGLPQASSLCGACKDICPARIDLPRMLLALRHDEVTRGIAPAGEQRAERWAAWVMGGSGRMKAATGLGRIGQRLFLRDGKLALPAVLHPAPGRELPSLASKSFRQMWQDGEVDHE